MKFIILLLLAISISSKSTEIEIDTNSIVYDLECYKIQDSVQCDSIPPLNDYWLTKCVWVGSCKQFSAKHHIFLSSVTKKYEITQDKGVHIANFLFCLIISVFCSFVFLLANI